MTSETPPALPGDNALRRWLDGDEDVTLDGLFWSLEPDRFDRLLARLHHRGRLPQHHTPPVGSEPDEDALHRLPEIDRLKRRYTRASVASQRLHALEAGWRHLAGRRPARWTISDLLAVLRRVIHEGESVAPSALVAAARDVWLDLPWPHGERQLALLLPCLELLRDDARRRRA